MSLAIGPAARMPSGFERLPGVTAPKSREPSPGFLSDTLVDLNLVDADHVEAAVHESRARGIPPEILLVEQNQVTEADLALARAEHAGLDYVDLDEFERDRDADALVGRSAAERFHALPIAIEGRTVVIALADPLDAPAIAEVSALAQRDVMPVVAARSAIESRIEELPERLADGEPPPPEPVHLQPIAGGPEHRASAAALPDSLAHRIVERVDATLTEVARSELVKALDDATGEIEQLSAKLEQAEQRAQTLERERDELRAALEERS
jgi:hypothetical protein